MAVAASVPEATLTDLAVGMRTRSERSWDLRPQGPFERLPELD